MYKSQLAHDSNLEKVRIDFMDVYHDVHQNEAENKKKSKNKRKYEARRGIEEYEENKRLRSQLIEWWEDL